MKLTKLFAITCFLVAAILLPLPLLAAEALRVLPFDYMPTPDEYNDSKSNIDDPRSLIAKYPINEQTVPKELHPYIFFDQKEQSQLWEKAVGFSSPNVVGKIAPEIKPGKYTYKDLEKYPGFKELLTPFMYSRIKPGGPPFVGNIEEFEIVPTIQMYQLKPIAEATIKNAGQAKLDDAGYLVESSVKPGILFPKPEGKFAAQQYIYNYQERYVLWGWDCHTLASVLGFDKNLKNDHHMVNSNSFIRLTNRVVFPPFGDIDEEATNRGETNNLASLVIKPRDSFGAITLFQNYRNPTKPDAISVWVPSLRRIRKLSGTDTQDMMFGTDIILDDVYFFKQRLSPTINPYKIKLVEDREYLMVATNDGTEYLDSKNGYAYKNIKMMRRPCVVVEMIQQDPNYVYGKREIWFDKETYFILQILNYNQQGELYRPTWASWSYDPKDATPGRNLVYSAMDMIDVHTTIGQMLTWPAVYDRKDLSLFQVARKGK